MKAGANDFVTKPWTNQQMLHAVQTALGLSASHGQADERLLTREELDERYDFGELVGRDPRMLRVLQLIGRVAATDASVLITGESGTGKELVAEAVHRNSPRAPRPFVKVNLGGISSSLFESEMFGHVRGAFTDARSDRKGRFEVAHGGTIFLDEIGDLDAASQVKMLRVLQDRTFEVLGSSQRREVDVRVISATNRSLADLVARGEFREDLLYRINLIADSPATAARTAGRHSAAGGRAFSRRSVRSTGARRSRWATARAGWLQAQPWPGNIRQLRQWVERAVLVASPGRAGDRGLRRNGRHGRGARPGDALPAVGA